MGPPKNNVLTPRDLQVAALVWQCFKSEPQIDYQKLAQIGNFKNGASASACWNPIKKKLMAQLPDNIPGSGSTSAPTTPAKKRGKKSVAHDNNDDDDESPTKKPRGAAVRPKKTVTPSRTANVEDELEEDDDEEALDIKPVKKEEQNEYEIFGSKRSFFDGFDFNGAEA